jgi:hypothetical protein
MGHRASNVKRQPEFRLTKWYFDCVADGGDTAIVYCARTRWHGLALDYSSVLTNWDGKTSCRSSLRRFREPTADGLALSLKLPALGLDGTWQGLAPAVQRRLFASPAGDVEWNCLQPRSQVAMQIDGRPLEGIGYAECLTLTLPPWKLPMRELRWGHFASQQHSVVWIDWQGDYRTRLLLHDGAERVATDISDQAVGWDAHCDVALDRRTLLRDGALERTILPAAPALKRIFRRPMFGIAETKWCSRAVLHSGAQNDSGWAIHEHVEWQA